MCLFLFLMMEQPRDIAISSCLQYSEERCLDIGHLIYAMLIQITRIIFRKLFVRPLLTIVDCDLHLLILTYIDLHCNL